MKNDIIRSVTQRLFECNLDAVIVSSPDNVIYTTGLEIPSQVIPIRERLVFSIITSDGKTLMLVPDMEYSLVKSTSTFSDIRMYNEFTQKPIEELHTILIEFGLTDASIAIEDDFIPGEPLHRLYKLMSQALFRCAKPVMSQLRQVKTESELGKLRTVNKIAERAHYYAASKVRSGVSELEMAKHLYDYLLSEGVETINKLVIGSGERSEHGNASPTGKLIQPGDLVRVDIFAKIGGYQSDVARTYIVGEPNFEQKQIWGKLLDARSLIFDMLKPGVRTRDIYTAFKDHFEKCSLTPINFVGHGLGITLHEEPYISKYHDTVLTPGMVLAIEPIYFSKGAGYQIEDIVAVTKEGYELITNSYDPSELIQIVL